MGVDLSMVGSAASYVISSFLGGVVLSPQGGLVVTGVAVALFQGALPMTRSMIWGHPGERPSPGQEQLAKGVALGITVYTVVFVLKLAKYIPSVPFPVKAVGALSAVVCALAKVQARNDQEAQRRTQEAVREQEAILRREEEAEAAIKAREREEEAAIAKRAAAVQQARKSVAKTETFSPTPSLFGMLKDIDEFRFLRFPTEKGAGPVSFTVVWNPQELFFEVHNSTSYHSANNGKFLLLFDPLPPELKVSVEGDFTVDQVLPENIVKIIQNAVHLLNVGSWQVFQPHTEPYTIRIIDDTTEEGRGSIEARPAPKWISKIEEQA